MPGLPFSGWELLLILAIALIVLGPGKLPDLGAAMGKTIREFRKAASDVQEAANLESSPSPEPSTTATSASTEKAREAPLAAEPVTAPANEREPDPALPPSVESTSDVARDPAAPVEPRGLATPPAPSREEAASTPPGGRTHVGG
jgi:TatA/E family protein of Tat protein translocase